MNLRATAEYVAQLNPQNLVVVCSGTREQTAYEDVLCAGGLADAVWAKFEATGVADSAVMARRLFQVEERDLPHALGRSVNGRRLSSIPDLQPDIEFCARRDCFGVVAGMAGDGVVRKWDG